MATAKSKPSGEEEASDEESIVWDSEPSRVGDLHVGASLAKGTRRSPSWEDDPMDLDVEEAASQPNRKGKERESGELTDLHLDRRA